MSLSPRHTALLLRHLHLLPTHYQCAGADAQRLTLIFFALAALDVLGSAHKVQQESEEWAQWIWERQAESGGFRPSPAFELPGPSSVSQEGDLAQTYTALLSLGVLRDAHLGGSRLQREALCALLGRCQKDDGSFMSTPADAASDVRFLYCAFALCDMLGAPAWRSINVDAAIAYLMRCRTFEGAFGQTPGMESHAGSTYCALAALHLSARLGVTLSAAQQADATRWLLALQQPGSGFAGRVGKEADVCYSFWAGASLSILNAHQHIDAPADAAWLLGAQHAVGGLGKTQGEMPDLLHSYLGLAALSMHVHEHEHGDDEAPRDRDAQHTQLSRQLARLDAAMNCTQETRLWLRASLEGME